MNTQNYGKPFSQACENNKDPILQVIRRIYKCATVVWEIGSGTGQHACYFAGKLPDLCWQPTDKAENLPGIRRWVQDADSTNLLLPLALDVNDSVWPCRSIDALFTANTLHIMSWQEVKSMFAHLATLLTPVAPVCLYGPFNYEGAYTSASNADFDRWLRIRDPMSGIRDVDAVLKLAEEAGLQLFEDNAMPANNRLLVLRKVG